MVVCCDNETGTEARLNCFGHVQRSDSGYTGQRMWNMECLAGRGRRGRPSRFMDSWISWRRIRGLVWQRWMLGIWWDGGRLLLRWPLKQAAERSCGKDLNSVVKWSDKEFADCARKTLLGTCQAFSNMWSEYIHTVFFFFLPGITWHTSRLNLLCGTTYFDFYE